MRPQFQRMMKDAKCGLFDTICVKDFSRFGRDYIETGKLIEIILPTLQIRFISVNDKFDSDDCKGMTGGISVGLKNLLNAMYSQDLSKKVKPAMNTRAGNGQYMASLAPYGYKKNPDNIHKLTIDDEAAANVRKIFTMASEGVGKTAIARYFNENDIPSPTAYVQQKGIERSSYHEKQKKLWTVTTITDMLKNQVYLGATVWNKHRMEKVGSRKMIKNEPADWCVTEGTHEPIVSRQLFELANEKAFREKRVKKKRAKSAPLVFCAYCGRRMSEGYKYHKDYRCATQFMSGIPECRGNATNQKELEDAVMTATRNMVSLLSINIEKKKAQWSQSARLKEEMEVLEQEKIRIKSRKMKLYERYRNESITKEKSYDRYNLFLLFIFAISVMPCIQHYYSDKGK